MKNSYDLLSILRKTNIGGDRLPFEYPLKEALKIYAWRLLVFASVAFVGLVPLEICWLMVAK